MSEIHNHDGCAACQSLALEAEHAAGDPKVIHHRIANENQLVRTLENTQDRVSDAITAFAGSMNFVYFHTAWFVVWVFLNVGAIGASFVFDKFPFGLLTMIVSLEAIFLSTFVMISQNRQASRSDLRAQVDFETNIRSEIWSVHIGQKLGIDGDHVEAVIDQAVAASRKNPTS